MADGDDVTVRMAVDASIEAATHLTDADAGAVAVLRTLADKIDTEAEIRLAFIRYADSREREVRPPKDDNVSIPTFLKYCDSLGLTPAGRKAPTGKPAEGGGDGGAKSGIAGRRQRNHLRSA